MTNSSSDSPFKYVSLVAHADWSKNPTKRWISVGILQPDHHWRICEPFNVEDPSDIFKRLISDQIVPGSLLTGFDFPIGLPFSYAQQVGISDFLAELPQFGRGKWQQFFTPSQTPSEISLLRPFYPDRPGSSSRRYLEQNLNISFQQLYRLCEIRHHYRRSACPLFWTLGAQQVGKAAISGWHDLLIPALSGLHANLNIWPFSGTIADCCLPGHLVVVETYPAEFYSHFGLSLSNSPRKSKRRQSDRKSYASQLLGWTDSRHHELDSQLMHAIIDGFGNANDGEDRYDSVVGLYGMMNIVLGNRSIEEPTLPSIQRIEGWIFGQSLVKGECGDGQGIQ